MGTGDEPLESEGDKTHLHLVPRVTRSGAVPLLSLHRNHAHILLDTVEYIHKPYYITVYQAAYIEIFTSLLHIVFHQFI
jgi:hypothetical protein